jgi:hypothetical protein
MGMFFSRQRPKIYPQMIDETSSTQKLPIGTEWKMVDGQTYRYMRAGANSLGIIGQPLCGPADVSFASQMFGVLASAGSNCLWIYNSAATSMTANQFAEGFLGTSSGRTYKVKTHPAVSALSGAFFTLYDNIVSAMASTVSYALIAHPLFGVQSTVVAAGMSTPIVGVLQTSVASLCYFWGKTAGVTNVVLDSNALLVSGLQFVMGSEGLGFGAKTSVTGVTSQITYGTAIRGTGEGIAALGRCLVALAVPITY